MAAQGPRMAAHSAPSFEVPCLPSFEVPGDKLQDQNFQVFRFIDPSDQNERHFTPFLCKIWSIEDNIALWDYPFKAQVSGLPEYYYFLIRS